MDEMEQETGEQLTEMEQQLKQASKKEKDLQLKLE